MPKLTIKINIEDDIDNLDRELIEDIIYEALSNDYNVIEVKSVPSL